MHKLMRLQIEELAVSVVEYYSFNLDRIAREQIKDDLKYINQTNGKEGIEYYKKLIRCYVRDHGRKR